MRPQRLKVSLWTVLLNAQIFLAFFMGLAVLGIAWQIVIPEFLEHKGTWGDVSFYAAVAAVLYFFLPRIVTKALRSSDTFVRSRRASRNPALQAVKKTAEAFIALLASRDRVTAPSFHLRVEEEVAKSPLGKAMFNNAGMIDVIAGQDAVVLGEGIARSLDESELKAVLAHEWGHKDIIETPLRFVLMVIRQVLMVVVLSMVLWVVTTPLQFREIWHCVAILFPMTMAFDFCKSWLSRCGEYKADATCYRITGDPETLIRALGKIEERIREDEPEKWERIANRTWFEMLFSSHPKTEQRAQALRWLSSAA